jgi:hypothetical protein
VDAPTGALRFFFFVGIAFVISIFLGFGGNIQRGVGGLLMYALSSFLVLLCIWIGLVFFIFGGESVLWRRQRISVLAMVLHLCCFPVSAVFWFFAFHFLFLQPK